MGTESMTDASARLRRRRSLELLGGILTGTLAGCLTVAEGFDGYHHVRDAPVDGPVGSPWPTLGSDSRRSGHTPTGWLPEQVDVSAFSNALPLRTGQPAFVEETAYFGGKNLSEFGAGPPVRSPGVIAVDQKGKGWFVSERDALAPPTVLGNALFVTTNGTTRAFHRQTGERCWEFGAGNGHLASAPTVHDGTVYVVDDRVVALAARTGELAWKSNELSMDLRGTAATKDGVFTTASGDGQGAVYRVDPSTGGTSWERKLDTTVYVPPVLGPLVYVMGADGKLSALDPGDGTVSWSEDLGGRSRAMPAVADDMVFAVATNGRALRAFDARTGTVRWEFTFSDRQARGPTIGDRAVYFPTTVRDGGFIYELHRESGAVRNIHELPKPPASPLVLALGMGLISTGSPSMGTRLHALTEHADG